VFAGFGRRDWSHAQGVAFFPAIFTGGDVAAHQSNPSLLIYCPNTTDKTLLHDGALLGENLRGGCA
jgi:hypothetical protein